MDIECKENGIQQEFFYHDQHVGTIYNLKSGAHLSLKPLTNIEVVEQILAKRNEIKGNSGK
ncbi:hypothetical protein [Nitrosomonas ureae]|uniref:Uncharacterized protein n=1 Tax=Nitrosomonas ureae TaxID=44577 RepID=A0A2T5ISW4_9PROT|nr:hypothetical protein [Nitrosomonas ureae]PTQ86931.1 hypothetical protein C8R28_1008126 [Nitrosomonas ureae]